MENLKIDLTTFSLMAIVLATISVGYFLVPHQFEGGNFLYSFIFLGLIGVGTFFLKDKGKIFRNSFLFAYFGMIISLVVFNVLTLVNGTYDNLLVKLIILASLIYYATYPFSKGKTSKQEAIA